jgi:hypothetical protein
MFKYYRLLATVILGLLASAAPLATPASAAPLSPALASADASWGQLASLLAWLEPFFRRVP